MAAQVVTVSAPFGAGGSVVGPAVAERLGLPFVDRAISAAVAATLEVPLTEVLEREERRPGLLARMMAALSAGDVAIGAQPAGDIHVSTTEDAFRTTTEEVLRSVARDGGVVLGRAGALVLANRPQALHVRLDGPAERRIRQAMAFESIDEATARRRLEETDRAREDYVRHFYRADPRHARHYHLVIDSTWVPVPTVVNLIVEAARAV